MLSLFLDPVPMLDLLCETIIYSLNNILMMVVVHRRKKVRSNVKIHCWAMRKLALVPWNSWLLELPLCSRFLINWNAGRRSHVQLIDAADCFSLWMKAARQSTVLPVTTWKEFNFDQTYEVKYASHMFLLFFFRNKLSHADSNDSMH